MSPASLMELPLEKIFFWHSEDFLASALLKANITQCRRYPVLSSHYFRLFNKKNKAFFTGQKHICLPDAKNKLLLNVCIDCLYEKNLCLRVQLYNNETQSKNLRKLCKTCAL